MSPGVIAILTFALGIVLSIAAMELVEHDVNPYPTDPKCGTVSAALLLAGFFITAIATPVIELIFFVIKKLTGKNRATAANNP